MLSHRIIPCLLLKGNGLVKTNKFREPRYVGDPVNAIRIFNEKEVDELVVLDIEASKRGQEPNYRLVEEFASECFMPLCYGGGVTSLVVARRLFRAGVEKLCIQTAALHDIGLVRQIVEEFGTQSVVVSVDVKKTFLGRYGLYASSTGRSVGLLWREFLDQAVAAGAGEILLTAVDRDGTMSGMDTELIRAAASSCPVPVVASGGASSLIDMRDAVRAGASAVAAGAFFVFRGPRRAVLITYPSRGDIRMAMDD